jgi:hypothetical protein
MNVKPLCFSPISAKVLPTGRIENEHNVIRILQISRFRYWTQASLGSLDEAPAESNHKLTDL